MKREKAVVHREWRVAVSAHARIIKSGRRRALIGRGYGGGAQMEAWQKVAGLMPVMISTIEEVSQIFSSTLISLVATNKPGVAEWQEERHSAP